MKLFTVLMALLLSGCGAQMVNVRGKSMSAYAPTNEAEYKGGLVKYLNQGADFVIKGRREDAYKQMYTYCEGPYRIVHEGERSDGAGTIIIPGQVLTTAYSESVQYWYIGFECN